MDRVLKKEDAIFLVYNIEEKSQVFFKKLLTSLC